MSKYVQPGYIYVETREYKGVGYDIAILDPARGNKNGGRFTYINSSPIISLEHKYIDGVDVGTTFSSRNECIDAVEGSIDEWFADRPRTVDEWIKKMEGCIIYRSEYEIWLDPKEAERVFNGYAEFKASKEENES